MSSVSIAGNTSGSVTLSAPDVAGSTTLTLPTTSGTVVVTSGSQTIEFADGSASTPSITNSGDTNTGIFFPAADTIAFAEGGAEAMRLDSSGNVGIGTASPTGNLDIASSSNVNVYIRQTTGVCNTRIKSDSTNAAIGTSTNHQFSLLQNNTEGLTIDTSKNLQFNSGYGSVATAYGCRAWVNFNGTGTVAIRASGNVTSITDGGVGNYTVNMTTAMPDTNYAVAITASGESRANSARIGTIATTGSTSAFVVDIYNPAAAAFQDPAIVMVEVFR